MPRKVKYRKWHRATAKGISSGKTKLSFWNLRLKSSF